MRKLFVFITLLMSACSSVPKYKGMCSHPALFGGAPFPLTEAMKVDGDRVIFEKDGQQVILLGAVCVLER